MFSRMVKVAAVAAGCLWSGSLLAMEPCHRGVPSITIEQGSFIKAPGSSDPDAQTLHPNGKLQEQRRHNLHAAFRPLKVICRYSNKSVAVVLPNTIDTCVWEHDERRVRWF